MAVTDLSQDMPWWARQGAGPTGGPSAAPQGGGATSQDWLRYMLQMLNPVGSANAAEPPPDDHGDGNNPPVSPVAQPPAPPAPPAPPVAAQPPAPPPAPPVAGPMPARPAGVSASGLPLQPGSLAPGALAQFGPGAYMPTPSGGGSMNPAAPPPPGQQAVGGAPAPAPPVPGPMATGGASGMGSTANPRFIGIDQPNASPQNSMRQGPQATALNLAGLFGGKPAAANVGVKGPMANGGGSSDGGDWLPKSIGGDNWDIDADGNVVPKYGDDSTGPQRVPRSKWPMPPRRPAGM